MKDYVIGNYYKNEDQFEAVRNSSDRLILNNLRDSSPNAKSVGRIEADFKDETIIVQSTIYSKIKKLEKYNYIQKLSSRQKKNARGSLISKKDGRNRGPDNTTEFYIFEEADNAMNLLSQHTDSQWWLPGYSLAPGYVEYDKEFLNTWNTLLGERLIDKEDLNALSIKILSVLASTFSAIIKNDDDKHCINCGINHDARNLVRALLLKILDHVELSPQYIEFLRERNVINESGVRRYEEARKYNENIMKAFSKPVKVSKGHVKSKLRIAAISSDRPPIFLALTESGSYIKGEGEIGYDMDVNTLLEYRNPLPTSKGPDGLPLIRINEDIATLVQEDDGSIPDRLTSPTTPISRIKKDFECYHINARVVSKEDFLDHHNIRMGILTLNDGTGEIKYHTSSFTGLFNNLKVGDRIDVIGVCHVIENRSGAHPQKNIWLSDPKSIVTVRRSNW